MSYNTSEVEDLAGGESPCSSAHRRRRSGALVVSILLILANAVVFGQVATFQFLIWDDIPFVVKLVERMGGLNRESALWAFTSSFNGWRTPLPYISLFLDASVYGLSPAGFHLTNLLIHTVNTVLLYFVLRDMTDNPGPSALAAALFGIHPLHVESVAWITARWELVCGLFWILGLWAYTKYTKTPSVFRYLLVLSAYACSLGSKPMALTFPCALLLLDYWPLCRLRPQDRSDQGPAVVAKTYLSWLLIEKIPLFGLMAYWLMLSYGSKTTYLATTGMVSFTLSQRFWNAIQTYTYYVIELFWPNDLSFFHPHPAVSGGFNPWYVTGSALLVVAISVLACLMVNRAPYFAVGWAWYLGVFVPAIGLVQVDYHARAERYTYLPLIGLSLIVCWGGQRVLQSLREYKRWLQAGSLACLVALMAAAHVEASYWKTDLTLFQHALRTDPTNTRALVNLGSAAQTRKDYVLAEQCFRDATKHLPVYAVAYAGLASVRIQQNRFDEAMECARQCLRIDPHNINARRLLAYCYIRQENWSAAEQEYQSLLEANQGDPDRYVWFGDYCIKRGQCDRACELYAKASALAPRDKGILLRYATALIDAGNVPGAIALYETTLRDMPHDCDVARSFAWLLATHKDVAVRNPQRAIVLAKDVVRRHGRLAASFDTLAAAYAAGGRYAEAVEAGLQASELAQRAGDTRVREVIEERLKLYRARQPYIESTRNRTANVSTSANLAS